MSTDTEELRKLCFQLQEVRSEREKTAAKISALTNVMAMTNVREEEICAELSRRFADPDGKITRHAVQVGTCVAWISTAGGGVSVTFAELV